MQAAIAGVSTWSSASVLGGVIAGLREPTLSLVRATLLRPLQLGPEVAATWALTRDVAMAFIVVVLLYGLLRAQLAPVIGLDGPSPWALLPRMSLAMLGIAASLPMVRGLLALNNALCAALWTAVPGGSSGLVRPLIGALAVTGMPEVLGIGPDVVALMVLIGLAALACSYLVRAAEIVLLTLLLPLVMALWLLPGAAGAYRAVAAHLLVAIFVQALQVVVLLVFASGLGVASAGAGTDWLWALAALTMLFRCRGLLDATVRSASDWVPAPWRAVASLAPVVTASRRAVTRLLADRAREATGLE